MNTAVSDISGHARASTLRVPVVAAALVMGGLWLVLCRHLGSEWSINEQYNYGWFVPFFAAYLFWLRLDDRPAPTPPARSSFGLLAIAAALLLLLLPIRLFEVANPDWRPLGWLHAAIVVGGTMFAVWRGGGAAFVRHFAFPIAFIFVAVPWISAVEQPIVQGLMNGIAAAAAETLTLFGIPAQLEGNLIRVSSGLVGVNEACSGVRSLQTSLMIGLLFGELKRLGVLSRFLLIGGAVGTALIANFARAFALVWIAATRNVQEVGRWHDLAGYAIVALVFAASMAIAAMLGKNTRDAASRKPVASDPRPLQFAILNPQSAILALAWIVAVEFGVESWYRYHEARAVAQQGWTISWPENAPGFRTLPIEEGVRGTLRFDEGREAMWNAPPARCLLYFFRWNAGGSSVVRARAHRPDICLPAAGWRQLEDGGMRTLDAGPGLPLAFRRVSFETRNGMNAAHTFFCLHEDRRTGEARPDLDLAAGVQPDWSFGARWRAVRNGVRNMGQQVMEFILLTPRDTTADEAEKRFAAMLPTLVKPLR